MYPLSFKDKFYKVIILYLIVQAVFYDQFINWTK